MGDSSAGQGTRSAAAWWLGAAALLVLARLPRLLSAEYVLDGDEAILGLMARHVARGEQVSLFFQGQSYGFSLLETFPAAASFLAFGAGPLVLSLTMLALFLAGLVAWERALRRLADDRGWSVVLVLALGLLPVWIVWSMKARGGYLTAFALSGMVLAITTGPAPAFTRVRAAAAGATAGVLFHAQALWLPPVLPFLLLPGLRGAPWSRVGLTAVAGGATALLMGAAQGSGPWEPGALLAFSPVHALLLPERLYRMFTGFFLLGDSFVPPRPVATVAASAATAFVALLLVLSVDGLRRRRPALVVGALSLLWCVAPVVFLRELPPRYLLQAAAFLFAGIAAVVGDRGGRIASRPAWAGATAALALLGATSVFVGGLRDHAVGTGSDVEKELRLLGRTLEANEVAGAYVVHGLLQWQMLFYGDERVPARSRRLRDRFPAYGARVDAARVAGERIVLVGPARMAPDPAMAALLGGVHPVGTDYFVVDDPPAELLRTLGFELPEDVTGGGSRSSEGGPPASND